jgi:hypothetical protein
MAGISTQMVLAINHGCTVAEAAVAPARMLCGTISSTRRRPERRQTDIASRRERRKLSTVKTGSDPCVRTLTGCGLLILPPLFLAVT